MSHFYFAIVLGQFSVPSEKVPVPRTFSKKICTPTFVVQKTNYKQDCVKYAVNDDCINKFTAYKYVLPCLLV